MLSHSHVPDRSTLQQRPLEYSPPDSTSVVDARRSHSNSRRAPGVGAPSVLHTSTSTNPLLPPRTRNSGSVTNSISGPATPNSAKPSDVAAAVVDAPRLRAGGGAAGSATQLLPQPALPLGPPHHHPHQHHPHHQQHQHHARGGPQSFGSSLTGSTTERDYDGATTVTVDGPRYTGKAVSPMAFLPRGFFEGRPTSEGMAVFVLESMRQLPALLTALLEVARAAAISADWDARNQLRLRIALLDIVTKLALARTGALHALRPHPSRAVEAACAEWVRGWHGVGRRLADATAAQSPDDFRVKVLELRADAGPLQAAAETLARFAEEFGPDCVMVARRRTTLQRLWAWLGGGASSVAAPDPASFYAASSTPRARASVGFALFVLIAVVLQVAAAIVLGVMGDSLSVGGRVGFAVGASIVTLGAGVLGWYALFGAAAASDHPSDPDVIAARAWDVVRNVLATADAGTRRLLEGATLADAAAALQLTREQQGAEPARPDQGVTEATVAKAVAASLALANGAYATPLHTTSGSVFTDYATLMRTTGVVCVQGPGMVITLFNEAMEKLTGFAATDVVRQSLTAMLADEEGAKEVTQNVLSVLNGGPPIAGARVISMVSNQQFTAQVRITYAPIYASRYMGDPGKSSSPTGGQSSKATRAGISPDPSGVALFITQEFDIERTNNVFLVKHRNAQLSEFISEVQKAISNDVPDMRRARVFLDAVLSVVRGSSWANISLVAQQMREWRAIRGDAVLDGISGNYMQRAAFKFQVAEMVECDTTGIGMMLDEILEHVADRVTATVGVRRYKVDDQHALYITLSNATFVDKWDPLRSPLIDTMAARLAAVVFHFNHVREVRIVLPYRRSERAAPDAAPQQALVVGEQETSDKGENSSETTVRAFTVAIASSNALYRHSIARLLWQLGHAIVNCESPQGIEALRDRDVHCVIVDSLNGALHHLFLAAISRCAPRAYIVTLVAGDGPGQRSGGVAENQLTIPVRKVDVDKVLVRLNQTEAQKLRDLKDLEEQRRILNTHRHPPWRRGALLGRGAFADVYEAVSDLTGATMAVKIIYLERYAENAEAELLNEIGILCTLTHPHIVHYFHCERAPQVINLFMEKCERSLQQRLDATGPLSMSEARTCMKQVLMAVSHVHAQGIAHRDIKPGNVLIGRDGSFKLSDFGTAARQTGPQLLDTAGTFKYMAHEVYDGAPYTETCDIWSLGILFLDIIGYMPSVSATVPAFYNIDNPDDETIKLPLGLSEGAAAFASMFLKKRSDQRAAASTLLRHPFLTNDTVGSAPSPVTIVAPSAVKAASNLSALVPRLASGPPPSAGVGAFYVEGDAAGSSDDDLIPGM